MKTISELRAALLEPSTNDLLKLPLDPFSIAYMTKNLVPDVHRRCYLSFKVHVLIAGWKEISGTTDCDSSTPGAAFSVGGDCWEVKTIHFIPPDLELRWWEMMAGELLIGEEPEEYTEQKARDWWLSDVHDDEYPPYYLDDMESVMELLRDRFPGKAADIIRDVIMTTSKEEAELLAAGVTEEIVSRPPHRQTPVDFSSVR